MSYKLIAREAGFSFLHDYKTNLLHLMNDEGNAVCNSRFKGWESDGFGADDFSCRNCIKHLEKMKAGK